MVALAPNTRNEQMQPLLLGALAAATPDALPGCDGLTVEVLVSQYDALARQGLVPTRQELLGRRAQAASLATSLAREFTNGYGVLDQRR